MPTNVFERNGRWISSGHYVIDHCGDAIVVHCGNIANGLISVQFVLDEVLVYEVACKTIEPLLLGMVVASKDQQAAVSEGMRLSDLFSRGQVTESSLLSDWRSRPSFLLQFYAGATIRCRRSNSIYRTGLDAWSHLKDGPFR
jgi:hypothetical protein